MKESDHRLRATTSRDIEVDYLLYTPEEKDGKACPLLLSLHGMGERGSDIELVRKHGPVREIDNGRELPFVVVAPQCPLGAVWQVDVLSALLNSVLAEHAIDQRRIYVTGLSMGGSGTWALANAFPGRFAAVAPICGPFTMIDPENFRNTPVWCFHGAMDPTVVVTDSLRMVGWIRQAGGDVKLTVYPDAAHDSWREAYAGSELYDWFLAHQLPATLSVKK